MYTTLNMVVNALVALFEGYVISDYLRSLLKPKAYFDSTRIFFYLLFCCGLTLLNILVNNAFVNATYALLGIFLLTLMFDSPLGTRIFAVLSLWGIAVGAELAVDLLIATVKARFAGTMDPPTQNSVGAIVSALLYFMIVKMIVGRKRTFPSRLPLSYWIMLFSVPVISVFIEFTTIQYVIVFDNPAFTPIAFIALAGALFLNIIIFHVVEGAIGKSTDQMHCELLEAEVTEQIRTLETVQRGIREQERRWTNVRAQLEHTEHLLQEGKSDKAAEALTQLRATAGPTTPLYSTGNPLLDALLTYKVVAAHNEGIDASVELDLPAGILLDDADICIIAGGVFDYTLDFCRAGGTGRIELQFTFGDNRLTMKFHGRTVGTGNGASASKDEDRHLALRAEAVRQAAEKYEGILDFQHSENSILTTVVLRLGGPGPETSPAA